MSHAKAIFCFLPTGLFRKPEAVAKSKKRRRKPVSAAGDDVILGSLTDLRAASKGGMDPSGADSEGYSPIEASQYQQHAPSIC